jgi:excisionase family DNA binding protein
VAEQQSLDQLVREIVRAELAKALAELPLPNPPPSLYSVKEAAALLRQKQSWLAGKVREGKVPHRRIGRRVFFNQQDIDAILERRGS